MAKKIFVGNYKGGVGKTTTVFEIGAGLAKKHGKKVLLVDLDPQCSLTDICIRASGLTLANLMAEETLNYALELYGESIKETSRLQMLEGEFEDLSKYIKNIIKPISKHGNLYFIPTSMEMKNSRINDIADRLSSNKNTVLSIAKLFSTIEKENEYDYIFIDCPPTSNIIIQGVFLYCDYYLIPTIGDELSINGVADYISEIESTYLKFSYSDRIGGLLLKKYFNVKPKLAGILETIYKNRKYATTISSGNTYRNNDNLEQLRNLDAAVTNVIGNNSVLFDSAINKYPGIKHIFKVLIKNLDNRSDPNNYGIPLLVHDGEVHDEYNGIIDIISNIL